MPETVSDIKSHEHLVSLQMGRYVLYGCKSAMFSLNSLVQVLLIHTQPRGNWPMVLVWAGLLDRANLDMVFAVYLPDFVCKNFSEVFQKTFLGHVLAWIIHHWVYCSAVVGLLIVSLLVYWTVFMLIHAFALESGGGDVLVVNQLSM